MNNIVLGSLFDSNIIGGSENAKEAVDKATKTLEEIRQKYGLLGVNAWFDGLATYAGKTSRAAGPTAIIHWKISSVLGATYSQYSSRLAEAIRIREEIP